MWNKSAILIATIFICQANADTFTSPRTFWAACGKEPAPTKCSGKDAMARMKEMCSNPSNQEDCKKLFQVFSARTLQPEAKTTLDSLYIQEQSNMASHNRYSDNFESVWTGAARGTKNAFYIYSIKSCNNGGRATTSLTYGWPLRPEIASASKTLLAELDKALSHIPCPKPTEFTLIAVGKVSPTGRPDVWEIDQKGKLKNIQSGIPDPFK